jgi:hypothetical protein
VELSSGAEAALSQKAFMGPLQPPKIGLQTFAVSPVAFSYHSYVSALAPFTSKWHADGGFQVLNILDRAL